MRLLIKMANLRSLYHLFVIEIPFNHHYMTLNLKNVTNHNKKNQMIVLVYVIFHHLSSINFARSKICLKISHMIRTLLVILYIYLLFDYEVWTTFCIMNYRCVNAQSFLFRRKWGSVWRHSENWNRHDNTQLI